MGITYGLETATSEISLVAFTTLAPSGAFALIGIIFWYFLEARAEVQSRVRRWVAGPLIITMAGLIASSTHLGNPANALYVLSHVGYSPLSNEVVSAVVFLGSAALFWMAGFATSPYKRFDIVCASVACVSGAIFLWLIAHAYTVSTIPTWGHPLFPYTILLSAAIAGPLVMLACLSWIDRRAHSGWFVGGLLAVSFCASIVWVAFHMIIGHDLASVSNHVFAAFDLAPSYRVLLTLSAVLLFAGWGMALVSWWKGILGQVWWLRGGWTLSVFVMWGGIFIMRFVFYMLHLTVGVSL